MPALAAFIMFVEQVTGWGVGGRNAFGLAIVTGGEATTVFFDDVVLTLPLPVALAFEPVPC